MGWSPNVGRFAISRLILSILTGPLSVSTVGPTLKSYVLATDEIVYQ